VAPPPAVAEPTFMPMPGMFTAAVSLTIADTNKDATIFYTLDGTNPNPNSKVYSGALALTATTTVRAYASATGFSDSKVASGTYTITIPANEVVPPTPAPQTGTSNNDFLASLSTTTAGATICFTLDGSTPVCTDGACQGGSQTYNAQTQIPINGTVTGKPAGEVTLNALACKAGMKDGVLPAPGVTYTLMVATPTLQGPTPDPTLHPYNNGTISPTVASATNGATALWTNSAANQPTCSNGTSITTLPSQLPLTESTGNQTVYVIGCKPGYLASTVEAGAYTFQLNPPNVGAVAPSSPPATYDTVVEVTLDDSANANATGEYSCVTEGLAPAAPACSATGCTTGKKIASGSQIVFTSDTRTGAVPPAGDLNVTGSIVEAVACSPKFAASTQFTSTAYTLQLDPVAFSCSVTSATAGFAACTSSVVPNGGTVWVQASQGTGTGEAYDYTCNSADGTTPTCACNTTANPTWTKCAVGATTGGCTGNVFTSAGFTAAATVKSVGCISTTSTPNGALGDVFVASNTPAASLSVAATGTVTAPVIEPTNPGLANPTLITFMNTEQAGGPSTYFCYTTNHTAPALNGTACYTSATAPAGTACTTSATLPGATSTDGVMVTTTGTWIEAVACDSSSNLMASAGATPVQYQLVVGTPAIATKGAVNFGETILVKSATSGAVIHYSISGTVPDCTASFPTITAGTIADAQGLYDATYYAMGQETGAFEVIGCKTGYTVSAGTDSTTFSYSVATPVVLEQLTNTVLTTGQPVDDTIAVIISEPTNGSGAGTNGSWFCSGANAGCSTVTPGQCTGSGTVATAACNIPLTTAANGAQPVTAPPTCAAGGPTLPLPAPVNIVACAPITPASATLKSSSLDTPNFIFESSAIALTSPATNAAAAAVTFAGTPSTTAPDGNAAATPAVSGATGNGAGGVTYMCASSSATVASLGVQPADCATFVASLPTTWGCCNSASAVGVHGATCVVGVPAAGLGEPGPTLTLPDQGVSGTYAAFSCKNGLNWSTSSFPVTFAPYVHTPAFDATGTTSDFTAGKENIAGIDGATAYVTFDATNLYVGFDRGAVPPTTDIVHFYIGSKANGTNAADNSFVTDGRTLPANFDALYHVFWKLDNSLAVTSDNWSGTAWVADGNIATVKYNAGSTFVEFTIPLASLALIQAGDIHLLGADWTGAADVGAWPTTNPDTGAWTSWQTEVLTDGFAPNDATRLDLP
jgi:hypothetical protein